MGGGKGDSQGPSYQVGRPEASRRKSGISGCDSWKRPACHEGGVGSRLQDKVM